VQGKRKHVSAVQTPIALAQTSSVPWTSKQNPFGFVAVCGWSATQPRSVQLHGSG
jgi:hypothetical protein